MTRIRRLSFALGGLLAGALLLAALLLNERPAAGQAGATIPGCPGAPPTRLILHERGRVLDDDPRQLRMRAAPGVSQPQVFSLALNTVFVVLDGPRCADDYAWYYVRYRNTEGWVAEGEPSLYYVEPYLPG